jgi:3-oxoacyl-[acyl-carrier protein] reductase
MRRESRDNVVETEVLHGFDTVITGAGSGMGAAAAARFARERARVVVSDIDEEAARAVARAIDPSGRRAIGLRCDVADADQCQRLVAGAEDFFGGPIDVFMANAGVSFAGDFLEARPETLRRIVDVNVMGSIFSAQAALRSLVRSPRASLVFTSSISGVTGRARRSVYNASKHALTGLVKALALEFGPAGVRVNAIAPGATDTPFLRAHLAKVEPDVERAIAAVVGVMPLGALIAPEDFADAAVFLVSPASRSITGHILVLDGGASAGRM